MKITDEMVERGCDRIGMSKQDVRDVLESALADVPEPAELFARLALKLAKARAWAEAGREGELLAILNGET